MQQTKQCPICNAEMDIIDTRFPNALCSACITRAIDNNGNKVEFFNESLGGGLVATHTLPDGTTQNDKLFVCTIDDKPCKAVEFHMGGTGIELIG